MSKRNKADRTNPDQSATQNTETPLAVSTDVAHAKGTTEVEIEETNSRTPRSSEDRESEMRDMDWQPARLLPTPAPKDGIDFRYVRVASGGGIDNINHSQALRDHWEPVQASEHPELGVVLSDVGTTSGQIILGGMMLMQRPSWRGDRIKEQIARESLAQVRGVDNSYLKDQSPDMRKFSDNQSRVRDFGAV